LNLLVEVAVNSVPGIINKTLTYLVLPGQRHRICKGSLVLVTVNKQRCAGLVVDLVDDTERTSLKAIDDVLEERFLSPELVELGRYLADRYYCPLAVALATLLPPATGRRLQRYWRWLPQEKIELEAALNLTACLPSPAAIIASYLANSNLGSGFHSTARLNTFV
jgi:primosomal protein N' (replication factor Y)